MLKVFVTIFTLGALFVTIQLFHFNPTIHNASENTPSGDKTLQTGTDEYYVIRVVDGDTFIVQNGSTTERVRIIGINTPESVDPRRQVECFGVEASKELKQKIENKNVSLEKDSTQQNVDRYGRWLRHVFLNGENIGQYMIEQGFAYEYTYSNAYMYQDLYKKVQREAKMSNKGLWSPQACK